MLRKTASKTDAINELKEQAAEPSVPAVIPMQEQLPELGQGDPMPLDQVERLEDNINRAADGIGKWVVQLWRGRAHVAKGLPTFDAYLETLKDKLSKASFYKHLEGVKNAERLKAIGVKEELSKHQLKALAPALDTGDAEVVKKVMAKAKKLATDKTASEASRQNYHLTGAPSATAINQAVQEIVNPPKKEKKVKGEPAPPKNAEPMILLGSKLVTQAEYDAAMAAQTEAFGDDPTTYDLPSTTDLPVEAPGSPAESENEEVPIKWPVMQFVGAAWHLDPDTGNPTGGIEVKFHWGVTVIPAPDVQELNDTAPMELVV